MIDLDLPIHVAAVQYATDMLDMTGNTEKVLGLIDDAAHTADILVIPETSFTGYWLGKDMEKLAVPAQGPLTTIISQIAVTRNAYICFCIAERDGDKIYNTSILVSADGSFIGKHRKVHLHQADIESGFTPGNKLDVFDTPIGRIGILICYDAFHIESARVLDIRGADIILIPSVGLVLPPETFESTMYSWETVLRANAKYGRCPIVWANKIGEDNRLTAIGNSMVLDSTGKIIARGGTEEEVVRTVVTLGRKAPRTGRRPELYAPISESI